MVLAITNKACTLWEANAFYRVESYNASWRPATTTVSVDLNATVGRVIPMSFANGWIFKWIVLTIYATFTLPTWTRNILLNLQENRGACTMPVASPWVVTFAWHWYTGWEQVFFSTAWTLPTGVVAGTRYYVKYINTDTFNISATSGGSNINFTGTSSGTHYLWTTVSSKVATPSEYRAEHWTTSSLGAWYKNYFMNDVNFTGFDTDITVDTTANKWRIVAFIESTGSWTPQLWYGTDAETYPHFAYCDNAVTLADWDIPIFAHSCRQDMDFTNGCVLGTSETIYGFGWLVCFNPNATSKDDVWFFTVDSTDSNYTLTLRWSIVSNGRAGGKIWTLTNRISAANQWRIKFGTPLLWTAVPSIRSYHGKSSTSYYNSARASRQFYWEYPDLIKTTLTADAELLQNKIVVEWDITWWADTNELSIWRQDTKWLWEYKKYVIQSISWQEITLTTNITTAKRYACAMVINLTQSKFWVVLENLNTGAAGFVLSNPNCLILDWYYNLSCNYTLWASARYYCDDSDAFLGSQQDNCANEWLQTNTYIWASATVRIPRIWMQYSNRHWYRYIPNYPSSTSWVSNANYKCGAVKFRNVSTMLGYAGVPWIHQELWDVDWFQNDNCRASYGFIGSGRTWTTIKNVTINWCSTYGMILDLNALNSSYENIYINQCVTWFVTPATAVAINNTFKNVVIWDKVACTNDYLIQWYFTGTLTNCNGFDQPQAWYENLNDTVDGTELRFVNYEDVATQDKVWKTFGNLVRCWTGLPDTKVLVAGDSYSYRLESIGWEINYSYKSPIGDKQWKSIFITVYCEINSANYYTWTYKKPKLKVIYDWGTIIEEEWLSQTGLQRIDLVFVPTTTIPEIEIFVTAETDAIGSDAYVYFWHFDSNVPTVRSMNNFSLALPILDIGQLETNATNVADAIMNTDLSLYNKVWSFAVSQKKIDATTSLIPSK